MILTVEKSLAKMPIPVAKSVLATSIKEVQMQTAKLKYPLVLKVVSDTIIHKTERGGVKIVHSWEEAHEAAKNLLSLGSVLVQERMDGVELFLGIKRDETFGHVLLFGLGGIYVELYKDVAYRVCPITEKDALDMIDELKGKAILFGMRGKKAVNLKALTSAMVAISKLPKSMPAIEELDINPYIINDKEGKAVDARLVVRD